MLMTKQAAEKAAVLLLVVGVLVSLIAGSLMAFATDDTLPAGDAVQDPGVQSPVIDLEALTAAVATPTLQLLTDETTLDAVIQKSLQDTIGAAAESVMDTGVVQDLADKKEAERKAKEKEAEKKAKEREKRIKNNPIVKIAKSSVHSVGRDIGKKMLRGLLGNFLK